VVRRDGVEAVRESSQRRWFAPGLWGQALRRRRSCRRTCQHGRPVLRTPVRRTCGLRRLGSSGEFTVPVCAVAGSDESRRHRRSGADRVGVVSVGPSYSTALAPGTRRSTGQVAESSWHNRSGVRRGMAVRRAVLGDAHWIVHAGRTAFTADFQTSSPLRVGETGRVPRLDSAAVAHHVTALVARGHHEEPRCTRAAGATG